MRIRYWTLLLAASALLAAAPAAADDPRVISFEDEPMVILAFPAGEDAQTLIQDYVTDLADMQTKMVVVYTQALQNFETTVRSSSSKEAKADILGAVLKTALDQGVGLLLGHLGATNPGELGGKTYGELGQIAPGIGPVIAVFSAVGAEMERAAKAAESVAVGQWIRDARTTIVDKYTGSPGTGEIRQQLRQELASLKDASEQNDFLVRVDDTMRHLRAGVVPATAEIERSIYEGWINAQFQDIGGPGCVELKFDMDDGAPELDSTTVKAPFGDQIADSLNGMIATGAVTDLLDLKVHKRVCFYVENLVGGTEWGCGWLDAANEEVFTPVLPEASKALHNSNWRPLATKFK